MFSKDGHSDRKSVVARLPQVQYSAEFTKNQHCKLILQMYRVLIVCIQLLHLGYAITSWPTLSDFLSSVRSGYRLSVEKPCPYIFSCQGLHDSNGKQMFSLSVSYCLFILS